MDGERRRLLVGTAGGLAALAGCSSPFEFGSSDSNATGGGDSQNLGDGYHAPSLDERPDGWEVTDTRRSTFEREKFGVGVKGYASTKVYEETALRDAVSEKTRGQFDGRLATFFATKINLTGEATAAADVDRIAEFAKDRFEGELDNQDLRNVREVDPSGSTPNVDGEVYEYRGEYETPEINRTVDVPDVGTRELVIPADTLPVAGLVSVWKPSTGVAYVGGGAFPAANYEQEDTISITSEAGDGIDLVVRVDLGLDPDALRGEVVAMTEQVG